MTDKKDEALKLALESAAGLALEVLKKHRQMKGEYPMGMLGVRAVEKLEAVFSEMDEALAEEAHYKKVIDDVQALFEAILEEAAIWQAAYETEKGFREQEQQELEAKRKWVGLTAEEVIIMSRYDLEYAALIGEVQRKLKEKNQ